MFNPYRTTAKLTRTRAPAAPKDRIQIQLADDGNRFYELGNTQEDVLDRLQRVITERSDTDDDVVAGFGGHRGRDPSQQRSQLAEDGCIRGSMGETAPARKS